MAELWRNHIDDAMRARCMRALKAVIAAESTMRAADAFVAAVTPKERREAYAGLRVACTLRVKTMRARP